jgi:hypothetical protein
MTTIAQPTTSAPPPVRPSAEIDLGNVLQGIALLGMVQAEHVQRLWLPHVTIWRARELLRQLDRQGLIVRTRHYRRTRHGTNVPPSPAGHWWALTKRGLEQGTALVGQELKTVGVRSRFVLAHDRMVVDTCVRLIELARPAGLSSAYVQREARLEYLAGQVVAWLTMDAVVYVRTAADVPQLPGVPWTTSGALPGEQTHRFAIEADGGTEGDSVIASKARAYQAAQQTAKLGTLPTVVWVVCDAERRKRIHRLWQQAWPAGSWLLATRDEVEQGVWWQYRTGQLRTVHVFGP